MKNFNLTEWALNHKQFAIVLIVSFFSLGARSGIIVALCIPLVIFDKCFIRAKGTSLWDTEGHEYLDFLGGYGALNLGHNHPEILAAVEAVKELPNLLQAAPNPLAGALARNLALFTPGELQYSFFGNSGAEAVEGALKLTRASTGRTRIISCKGSFHGKSFGALSVTGRENIEIVDEIQTGFGRTGTLFACEQDGIAPDILCLSKSFGCGVIPLAAYSGI